MTVAARPAHIRPEIVTSWHRSQRAGVDPDRIEISHVDIEPASPFVRIAAPVLLGKADLLVSSSTSMALTDITDYRVDCLHRPVRRGHETDPSPD